MIKKKKKAAVSMFDYTPNGNIPKFPIEIFPIEIHNLIETLDKTANFEPQITAGSILFTISTIIGNTKEINVKKTWIDTPNLWLAIVGLPGTMKTPTVSFALKPLKNKEDQFADEFKKNIIDFNAIPKKEQSQIKRPERQQRFSNDVTVEGLIKALYYNENGMGIYKDELKGFFEEMNRYQSGGNLEFYLSAFSGGGYTKNRMGYDPITISNVFLSMLGGIQPKVLKEISVGNVDNGMIDRWLYILSENRIPITTMDDIDDEIILTYNNFIDNLMDMYYKPIEVLKWEGDSYRFFIEYLNEMEKMMIDETTESSLRTYLSKMKTYMARFVVIIATMHRTEITTKIVDYAAGLCQYFIETALNTFIGFDNQINIDLIFQQEKAISKKQKVLAIIKNLPQLNNTEVANLIPCSRQYVIKCKL